MPSAWKVSEIASVAAALLPGGAAVAAWGAGRTDGLVAGACAALSAGAGVIVWRTLALRRREETEARARSVRDAALLKEAGRESASLRAAFDHASGATLLTDGAGRVLLCNADAERFFARPAAAISGRHVEELFTQADILAKHRRALAGEAGECRVRIGLGGQPRTFEVRVAPAPLGAGAPGVLTTLRDVTDLALASQLKTDFVANASHEIRTPLASIKAAIETLADGAWDDPAMRERLAKILQHNVVRLEDLVADLLDLSRLESPEAPIAAAEIDAVALCERLRESFEPALGERSLTLTLELDERLSRLTTDARLLELILRNLVDNAAKFAYERTTIRLAGGVGEGGRAWFRVTDRGIGIPLAQQQRVFERFYQVDASRAGSSGRPRGTGLGLAIVKHAVNALGGTVSVSSVWKEGTQMRVEGVGAVGTERRASAEAPGPV